MNRLVLVIPTHRRVDRQITLFNLPPKLRAQTVLVASDKREAAQLSALYGRGNSMHAGDVRCTPPGVRGIAAKRHWIMRNVGERDDDVVFMLDDDLVFYHRCSPRARRWTHADGWVHTKPGGKLLVRAKPEEVQWAFDHLRSWQQEEGYGMVGIASRMGNNRVQQGATYNTRQMHAFGVYRRAYSQERANFSQVECREDMHVTLQLLRAGWGNMLLHTLCVAPGAYNAPGGASEERTVESSNREAERLRKLHPDFVRLVQKEYKVSVPRVEVACAWKKAFDSSGAKR